MIRHRPARSRSPSYDSVSLRRHSRSPSRSRGKKKSHKKRKHSSTSSSSSCRSSSTERERKRHTSKKKKKKHSKSLSSKRDKSKKKHKRKRSLTPPPSPLSFSVSSDSSSSLQRSPARKKSRISRSSSPADDNPHSVARAESPVSHRDSLSLYADNSDEFNNSQSEDVQDLAPDNEVQHVSEAQSDISQEYMNLVEEVFRLLPADMFPKKTEELLGGIRLRSSIELEMGKSTRKSISLPQSRRPLMKAVECLNESLGASEVDGTFPMPPTITQDWVPSRADIKKQVKFKFYQAHNEFIPTASASVLDPDATRLGMSLNGSYPVKVSATKDLETLSRDTIKILSQAEMFSFAAFKSLQSENMDSKILLEILKSMSRSITDAMSIVKAQTLGLQQAIESAPKGFLTDEAKRKLHLSSFTSKLLFDRQVSTIYKENMTENQETLIRNAVSYSAKPNPSSSSKKPKAKSGKKKSKPQETPKKDFSFPAPRPPKGGTSYRGSSSRGRGGGPSKRGASAPKKH